MPALIGAGLAGLLLLASSAAPAALLAGVVVLQAVLTLAGLASVRVPATRPAVMLALLTGITGAGAVWALGGNDGLAVAVSGLGVAFILAVALQLARRDGRPRLTASLSLAATAAVAATLPVWWVAARATGGSAAVALGLAGAGVPLLLEALPGPRPIRHAAGVVIGAAAGAALGLAGWPASVDAAVAAAVAGAAAGAAVAGLMAVRRVVTDLAEDGGPAVGGAAAWALPAALPLCASAPVTYLLTRLLLP